ncbi:winged helix-turn-helix transcriptional regulator [Spongiibacter sp. KMU-158]|uniref:Winged helix-turn-helix transcriptional regulator n=1 Tax=Spongiibacter pelagi TaxID=2760804 RepID=A0A927C1D3_9GAMM|nr:helix-turn-helix domain-containing protein [Spongiibacter pelagi]MBD2858087.1 winged helix-turn-helix transcriptional regulator [Spongiibacter pelagi]
MKKVNDDKNALIGTLAYALYWVDESLQASLEAAGWDRVTRTRSMLMVLISAGVNRPADLARSIGVSRQAIHQLIQGMKEEGIVELAADPNDRRAKTVQFSPKADQLRTDAAKIVAGIEKELSKRIGATEFKILKKTLGMDWGKIVTVKP